jgi:Protein of unknown function (DUF3263)
VDNYAQLRGAPPPACPPKPSSGPVGDAAPPACPPKPGPTPAGDAGILGERERGVLAFERHWWRHAGAKEEAIRREFGVGPTAYYQLLSRLIDDPAALAYDPMLVKRLQRQRASRRRRRSRRRLGPSPSGGS